MWSALRWVALGLAALAGVALLVPATVGFASLLILLPLIALIARLMTLPGGRDRPRLRSPRGWRQRWHGGIGDPMAQLTATIRGTPEHL